MTRQEHRLSVGDYLTADNQDGNFTALCLFLEAVQDLVPACLADLRAIASDVPERFDPSGDVALNAWATTWGLTSAKLVRVGRATAGAMRRHPTYRGEFLITGGYWSPDFPALEHPAWDPLHEKESVFRARVEAYIHQIKATPGLVSAPTKRSTTHHPLGRSFEWLALHQVARWTLDKIAEKYQDEEGNPTVAAVSLGVKDAAALVGLTLRPTKGRPGKVKAEQTP